MTIKMTEQWIIMQSERQEMERRQAEAELQNLKSQLNPHFLFNTLNNIYSLIAISPEKAQNSVHELSRLLRYVLYDSNQPLVLLEKEMQFIQNYVELMRIRLPRHATVDLKIEGSFSNQEIAPLLFISLIENAFKHGVSNSKPSFIHIQFVITASSVSCDIQNSFFPKDAKQDKSGSGIGLVNLEKRLELIYPQAFIFSHKQVENSYQSSLQVETNQCRVSAETNAESPENNPI